MNDKIVGTPVCGGLPCHLESMSFCFQDMLGTVLWGVSICLVTAFGPHCPSKDVFIAALEDRDNVALWGQRRHFFADRNDKEVSPLGVNVGQVCLPVLYKAGF